MKENKHNTGMSPLWHAVALGTLALQAELSLALPMLGPRLNSHQHAGLALVQTGREDVPPAGNSAESGADLAAEVDEDPCHLSLGTIFDGQQAQDAPATVLLSFMQDYCVEAADAFLPSKIPVPHFSVKVLLASL